MSAASLDHPARRHALARRRRLLGACVAGVAVISLLGGCSAKAPSEQDIRTGLIDSGLSEELATCAAKALDDNLTDQELADIAERGGGGAPTDDPNRDDDSSDKVRAALQACRDAAASTSTTVTTDPSEPVGPTAPVATTDGASIDTTEP